MSAALWSFFWTTTDWTGGTPSPPPPPGPPSTPLPPPSTDGSGGGHGKHKHEYIPAPEDLWDYREKYLRSLQPAVPPAPSPIEADNAAAYAAYEARQQEIASLNAERSNTLIAMRSAADIKQIKALGTKVSELNAKISTLTGKQAFTRFMH